MGKKKKNCLLSHLIEIVSDHLTFISFEFSLYTAPFIHITTASKKHHSSSQGYNPHLAATPDQSTKKNLIYQLIAVTVASVNCASVI